MAHKVILNPSSHQIRVRVSLLLAILDGLELSVSLPAVVVDRDLQRLVVEVVHDVLRALRRETLASPELVVSLGLLLLLVLHRLAVKVDKTL